MLPSALTGIPSMPEESTTVIAPELPPELLPELPLSFVPSDWILTLTPSGVV